MCSLMEELQYKGRLEGIEETKRKMAINFLKLGISPEQVATATGLSIEELSELENNI